MSEAFLPAPRPVPAAIPPLPGFTAGFVDSCIALALFGLFVAQVTGSSGVGERGRAMVALLAHWLHSLSCRLPPREDLFC